MTRSWLLPFGLGICVLGAIAFQPAPVIWRQDSFQEFRRGTLEDGGANLYVSARGAVQLVNRWDYNNDGNLDLLFVGNHDNRESLDASLYTNRGGAFDASAPAALPTSGGNWGLIRDLDGDGFADIVIANTDNGTLGDLDSFVYWGSAKGFSPRNRSELPTFFAGKPAAADLNKNGYIDLVFPSGSLYALHPGDEVYDRGSYVYWGGPGGFRKESRLELPTSNAKAAAVADFDGDGWPDIAFANYSAKNNTQILIGGRENVPVGPTDSFIYWGGPKGFSPDRRTGIRTDQATMVRTYDLDGDGRPEPVFLDRRGLVVCRNLGGRRLEPVLLPEAKAARDFAIADLNRDGRPDLVLARDTGTIALGTGALKFAFDRAISLPVQHARSCEAADLDGNGYPDIVFLNNNDGDSYDTKSYVYWNGLEGFSANRRQELPSSGAASAAVGDVNRDGRPDLLILNAMGGHLRRTPTYIYFGNTKGEYTPAARRLIETEGANDGASADFNDDGYTDLVLTQNLRLNPQDLFAQLKSKSKPPLESDGKVEAQPLYWGGPDSFANLKTTYLPMFGSYGASVADLNRDGYLDLVLSGYFRRSGAETDVSRIYYGGPDGFTLDRITELDTPGAEPSLIADFNRDGWLDIVFPNRKTGQTEGSILYWGGPNGYSKQHSTILQTAHTTRAQAADLDGDGWLDLIFSNQIESGSQFSSTLIYWGGLEGFSTRRHTRLPTWGGYGICVADYNRDGYLDIAVPSYKGFHTRTTESRVFWGGAQGFNDTNYAALQTESGAECMAADFNRDGWTDLLILCHRRDANSQAPGQPADHATNSFLYWSGPGGFQRKPYLIPTVGTHCNNSVDYGNVYDRKLRWGYTSAAFDFGGRAPRTIHWNAATPFRSFVRFQIRTAPTAGGLSAAPWRGPDGPGGFYTRAGQTIGEAGPNDRWMQYRFELGFDEGTGNPEVTAVEFRGR